MSEGKVGEGRLKIENVAVRGKARIQRGLVRESEGERE